MMSILVNDDKKVCVISDNPIAGVPSGISFNPTRRTLTLEYDDGHKERLGTAGLSEICRLLHKIRTIRFMMLRSPEGPYNIQLPLYVRMDEDGYAVAI